MKTLSTVASLLVVFSVASCVKASNKTSSKDKTKADAVATRVSKEGFQAMRAVHSARVSIFNGNPDGAVKLMKQAETDLKKIVKDEQSIDDKTDLIAIDGSIGLADTFVPSKKKAKHISKANDHLQKGNKGKALEELRLGEIEVSFTRVLMPLDATRKRLGDAIKLANEKKFYEANLALKAAEDGLTVDSISLIDFPAVKKSATKSSSDTKTDAKKSANK